MKVARRATFRAHHSLPDLPQPWNHEHGHIYTIEVEGEGDPPYAVNMETWDRTLDQLCTIYKDTNLDLVFSPSTVEVIAQAMLKDFPDATALTIWEDQARWARAER